MSRVGAFFDVDRTIVSCNTGRLFLRDLRRRGEISLFRTLRALVWMAKYHLSLIDLQWMAARIADQMEDKLDAGMFDGMAQGQMQAALDASLQKLKSLIEAAAPPAAT